MTEYVVEFKGKSTTYLAMGEAYSGAGELVGRDLVNSDA